MAISLQRIIVVLRQTRPPPGLLITTTILQVSPLALPQVTAM